jgi:hypothetical protein
MPKPYSVDLRARVIEDVETVLAARGGRTLTARKFVLRPPLTDRSFTSELEESGFPGPRGNILTIAARAARGASDVCA